MPNTYGRQVVLPLTNKSGGGVVAGDVVIIDTTNNDAFTTNTAANFTGTVGVAQGTIANNASGPVLLSGYASLINVNASVTRGHYGSTYTVAKQATDAGATRTAGTFVQFSTGGTTPDGIVYPVDLSSGAASGVPAGTSFPGSPATNDLYFRTDRGLIFYYNGSVWLSVTLLEAPMQPQQAMPLAATQTSYRLAMPPLAGNSDIWLDRITCTFYVAGGTALDGSNKWIASVFKSDNVGGTSVLGAFTINSGASSVWRKATDIVIGAAATASTYLGSIETAWTLTGTPGNLYHSPYVVYRYVG